MAFLDIPQTPTCAEKACRGRCRPKEYPTYMTTPAAALTLANTDKPGGVNTRSAVLSPKRPKLRAAYLGGHASQRPKRCQHVQSVDGAYVRQADNVALGTFLAADHGEVVAGLQTPDDGLSIQALRRAPGCQTNSRRGGAQTTAHGHNAYVTGQSQRSMANKGGAEAFLLQHRRLGSSPSLRLTALVQAL